MFWWPPLNHVRAREMGDKNAQKIPPPPIIFVMEGFRFQHCSLLYVLLISADSVALHLIVVPLNSYRCRENTCRRALTINR